VRRLHSFSAAGEGNDLIRLEVALVKLWHVMSGLYLWVFTLFPSFDLNQPSPVQLGVLHHS
jgi:hypothetical protein